MTKAQLAEVGFLTQGRSGKNHQLFQNSTKLGQFTEGQHHLSDQASEQRLHLDATQTL